MAAFRFGFALVLTFFVSSSSVVGAEPDEAARLYDHPVLVIDAGMHTAMINRADIDATGRWAVTGSDDKTIKVWSLAEGQVVRTIRLPAGPGDVGKVFAVAISPDGALIAAAGWTRYTKRGDTEQIYLFDREIGAMAGRIEGLPDVVNHLVFSRDGQNLVAVLGSGGMRVYARSRGWSEVARDSAYGADSYGAAFAADGRLATTDNDREVRLYASIHSGELRPSAIAKLPSGFLPYGISFSPDGTRLAIGDEANPTVDILDGRTLAKLPGPDIAGIDNGGLSNVAWSRDGRTLFAAGKYKRQNGNMLIFEWDNNGSGKRREVDAGINTVMGLEALPAGDLLAVSSDPWVGRLQSDGSKKWLKPSPKIDFTPWNRTLLVAKNGMMIDFKAGTLDFRLDLIARTVRANPPIDNQTEAPNLTKLPVTAWFDSTQPELSGQKLLLEPHEMSRSIAVHPNSDRFILGADWTLTCFDAKGKVLWKRPTPGAAWMVNVTGDGRLVVAAYDDGTIRWHRISDGVELLAFMQLPDGINWIAWSPEGFYDATPGARGVLRWHVNHGWDAAGQSIPVEDIPGSYRPRVLPLILQEMETPRALGLAELAEHNKQVAVHTHSEVPPGTRLHLLTIGISTYNQEYAKNLRLQFADRDASDLASAIDGNEGSLYAKVNKQRLINDEADKDGILRALSTMRRAMLPSSGDDLAVVHFSGHGALIDHSLYLLPYDVDARDDVGIEKSAISIDELRKQLGLLAEHGRVLVLLDACHSGATTASGAALPMDATALRSALSAPNISVITSSSGSTVSREDPLWQHGAFTKVLLDALADPAADPHHTGLIGTAELAHYLATHVRALTDGKQVPDMDIRFDTTLFVSGG